MTIPRLRPMSDMDQMCRNCVALAVDLYDATPQHSPPNLSTADIAPRGCEEE